MSFAQDGRNDYRRFECTAGTSDKFWEIRAIDRVQFVYYGRRGTAGQPFTKEHSDPATCQRGIAKLIKSKLAKGYVETVVRGSTMTGAKKPEPRVIAAEKAKLIEEAKTREDRSEIARRAWETRRKNAKAAELIAAAKSKVAKNPIKPKKREPKNWKFKRRMPRLG